MQVTRETAEGKQLLESLARWQQMAAEVVRVRLLMAVTADPSTIALKSACGGGSPPAASAPPRRRDCASYAGARGGRDGVRRALAGSDGVCS